MDSLTPHSLSPLVTAQGRYQLALNHRSAEPCVPSRKGNPKKLLEFAGLQRVIQRRVTLDFGYEYHYVPADFIDVVQARCKQWCDNFIW